MGRLRGVTCRAVTGARAATRGSVDYHAVGRASHRTSSQESGAGPAAGTGTAWSVVARRGGRGNPDRICAGVPGSLVGSGDDRRGPVAVTPVVVMGPFVRCAP